MAVSARGDDALPVSTTRGKHARRHTRMHPGLRFIRETIIVVVLALLVSVAVRAFVVQAFYVPSSSMSTTLQPGDRILAVKPRIGEISRGEVVVFKDPGGWLGEPMPVDGVRGTVIDALTFIGLLPSDSGSDLVKRVIGIAGDRVACCDAQGRLVVNGAPLDASVGPTDQVRFDVIVPPDSVFVLGDNRGDSRDSRFFLDNRNGSVPVTNIVGRAGLIIWPLDRIGMLDIPDTFDGLPRG